MIGRLGRWFGGGPGGGGGEEPALTFARAKEEVASKAEFNRETWGLGDTERWDADLTAGTITFWNRKGWRIVAPVQVIGTFNTLDDTWLWGWDHPSVPAPLAEHARAALAFGERHGLPDYTTRKMAATEAECWTFTAVAAHLAGAQGSYRGPTGTTMAFMTFGRISIDMPGASETPS